jgi:cytochrome c-type biogenesis protein CcmE
MTPKRRNRIILITLMLAGVGVAVGFALKAFNENLMFFYKPSEVVAGTAPAGHLIRVGGLVTEGSVQRQETITVQYTGILPDLFREGQGIVARGRLGEDRVFVAEEVLAKHDENYMPPEVADALKTAHEEGMQEAAAGGMPQ